MRITIEGSPNGVDDGVYEVHDDKINDLGVESDVTWHREKAVNIVRRLRVNGDLNDTKETKLRLLAEINKRNQPC